MAVEYIPITSRVVALWLVVCCLVGESGSAPRYALITLLHTNDLHGNVWLPEQPQGLSRIGSLVRGVRAEMPNVLLLDGGDIIHGTPAEYLFRGKPVLSAMNALGYNAAVVGNHEFDMGQEVLQEAIRQACFPLVSANVLEAATGKSWDRLKPYHVIEVDGFRIALLGLTTLDTVKLQWPRTLAGVTIADPLQTACEWVPRLRTREKADVIIALSHLGIEMDKTLAQTVQGIDIIVGGHSHTAITNPLWVGNTLIVQTGAHARAVGRVDFIVHRRKDGTAQIVSINGRDGRWWGTEGRRAPLGKSYPRSMLIVVDSTVPHDTAVLRAYMPYARRVHRYLDERLTEALDDLPVEGTTRGETAIGNLIADAVRQQAGTDIAFAAADLVNAGIQKGVVRVRDAYRVLGSYTRQHIGVAKVPGSLLREVLHRAITRARVRLQVSGLRINGDQILVNGDPLDRDRCYTVAAAAHIIQDYFWGATVGILSDDVAAATVRDAFITYLRAHAPLRNITEGRISHITGNTLSIGGGQ